MLRIIAFSLISAVISFVLTILVFSIFTGENGTLPIGAFSITCGVIFVVLMLIFYFDKCPKCKKGFMPLSKIATDLIDEKPAHVIKKLAVKNSKGEVTQTKEQAVPATTYYYDETYKCKFCGYITHKTKMKTVEN